MIFKGEKIIGTIVLMLHGMPPNLEGQVDNAFCEELQTKSKHWILQWEGFPRNLLGKKYNKILTVYQIPDDFFTASWYRKLKYSSDGYCLSSGISLRM